MRLHAWRPGFVYQCDNWPKPLDLAAWMGHTTGMNKGNDMELNARCLALAEDMADNGICWADEEDVNDLLAGLAADGSNLEAVAWSIAEAANWMN